jgi:hypothetical protein
MNVVQQEYAIKADGLWAVSVGQQVLVRVQLPPYDAQKMVLVRGEVVDVMAQVCDGIPLKQPVCRVLLDLSRCYHPVLAAGEEAVELEDGLPLDDLDDDETERQLDWEYREENPPINELLLPLVVKSCWPEHIHGWHTAFEEVSHEGLVASGQWVGSKKPRAQAIRDCWMNGEL